VIEWDVHLLHGLSSVVIHRALSFSNPSYYRAADRNSVFHSLDHCRTSRYSPTGRKGWQT
jgi:hypothetical protein